MVSAARAFPESEHPGHARDNSETDGARTKLVALVDDPVIPPSSVWKLMENFPNAPKRQLVLDPRDYGLGTVGHIGAFAKRNAVLWPQIVRDFTPFKKAIAP